MQYELLPKDVDTFLERFEGFHDAVIHEIHFDWFSKKPWENPYTVTLTLGAFDVTEDSETRLVNITLKIVDIEEVNVVASKRTRLSIMYGLKIAFFSDRIFLNFFADVNDPSSKEYFERMTEGNRTRFVLAGKRCFWEVSPYQERNQS